MLAALEDITDLTGRDVLTGGYNRQGFLDHTKEILKNAEKNEKFAVLFFKHQELQGSERIVWNGEG